MSTILINTEKSTVRDNVNVTIPGAITGGEVVEIPFENDDAYPILAPERPIIDVVNDFAWYAGPKASDTAINKLPCAFLIEREQLLSSLISGALYYFSAGLKGLGNTSETLSKLIGPTSLLGNVDLNELLANGASFLKEIRANLTTGLDKKLLKQHNLNSLQGIYLTKPTGFEYRLPFYDNKQSVTNVWGANEKDGLLAGFVDKGMSFIDQAAEVVNLTQPGVYIEKPKYFQHAEEGEERTITFPLINTIRRGTHSPVQQNYELLWLLTFQNKAYKTSFARTPPPKLYTVSVPGQFSFPYAYISNMEVEFLGTVRRSTVTVPILKDKRVTTTQMEVPVPEAYNVSLTFKSLISDYGNTMMSDAFNASIKGNKVVFGAR